MEIDPRVYLLKTTHGKFWKMLRNSDGSDDQQRTSLDEIHRTAHRSESRTGANKKEKLH